MSAGGMPFVYVMRGYIKGSKAAKFVELHPSIYRRYDPAGGSPTQIYACFKYPIPAGRKAVPDHLRILSDAEVKKIYGKGA